MKKRVLSIVCVAVLLFSNAVKANALSDETLSSALENVTEYTLSMLNDPNAEGEWFVLALTGSGAALPSGYLEKYYSAVEEYVCAQEGVLSQNKYTEYSSVVLGITAAGYDAADVAGYDLTAPLNDYAATVRQGVNGAVFALLALDSGNYPCDVREDYVDYILSRQLEDGGWALSGTTSDADVTAMALQALAKYTHRAQVAEAVEQGVGRLSQLQREDGSYASYGLANAESTAQAVIALCELGISQEDPRFVKNGLSALDALVEYQTEDGSFFHTLDGRRNGIATEQAFMALAAARRQADGMGGIYRVDERYETPRFTDISGHWAEESILYCVDTGLFQGTGERMFSPDQPMSRAMLVTVLWRLDGAPKSSETCSFSDVSADAYYADAIAWAAEAGVTDGYSDGTFGVNDRVTRQQMALFLYRYAGYKGCDVTAAGDLSGFADGDAVASWAETAMSWANGAGIVTGSTGNRLLPGDSATRAQVAVILTRFVEEIL